MISIALNPTGAIEAYTDAGRSIRNVITFPLKDWWAPVAPTG
jgi:hypothetical protein